MSDRAIETAVELAILYLGRHPDFKLDRRSTIHSLYSFQERFDTQFTHFRLMEVLLSQKYAYRFEVGDHPSYDRCKGFFERDDSFYFVPNDPCAPDGSEAGYVDEGALYCDAGSDLWREFVAKGVLQGDDARAPELIPIGKVVQALLESVPPDEHDLIGYWYKVWLEELLSNQIAPGQISKLQKSKKLSSIRALVQKSKALQVEVSHRERTDLEGDYPEFDEFISWWFDLDSEATDQNHLGTSPSPRCSRASTEEISRVRRWRLSRFSGSSRGPKSRSTVELLYPTLIALLEASFAIANKKRGEEVLDLLLRQVVLALNERVVGHLDKGITRKLAAKSNVLPEFDLLFELQTPKRLKVVEKMIDLLVSDFAIFSEWFLFDAFMRPLSLNVDDFPKLRRQCVTLSARVFEFHFDPKKTKQIDKRGFSRLMMLAKILRNADAEDKRGVRAVLDALEGDARAVTKLKKALTPEFFDVYFARLRQDFGSAGGDGDLLGGSGR